MCVWGGWGKKLLLVANILSTLYEKGIKKTQDKSMETTKETQRAE